MKPHSIATTLAAIAVASFASMALLAPIAQAKAGNSGNARAATAQTKVNTGSPSNAAGRLQCVGPSCPGARANEVRATTTGTYSKICQHMHLCHYTN
jgi:hypothetical protein